MVRRELGEGVVVVEVARHEPEALGELAARPPRELGARVRLHRVVHDLGEVLVGPVAAREPDQAEAGRQQAAVREVVDRRHDLLARQVAGDAEDAPGRTARRSAASRRSAGRRSGLSSAETVPGPPSAYMQETASTAGSVLRRIVDA